MDRFEILDIGLIKYQQAIKFMNEIYSTALENRKNYLILCQHYDVYTIGYNEKRDFPVETVKTDRGGSIVFHTPGQQIFYFVFEVKSPRIFYRKVIDSFYKPLKQLDSRITYLPKIPGFYIDNRKLGFLGFRYKNGYSLHGVAINHDVNLEKFNIINPCGLEGYKATSLKEEGINIDIQDLKDIMVKSIVENFK
ncbi:MAG: lipoyl(octanoyl) transferase LipB [Hydrogenothermaceae bacterium]